VFNAPYSNTRSVAELVVAEAIMLMRGIPQKNAQCHRGGWSKSAAGSHEVRGKTLGIVGYGHIGTQVGVLAEGAGHAGDLPRHRDQAVAGQRARQPRPGRPAGARPTWSPCTCRKRPATQNMIGAAQLAAMKPGAHLINASRGTVVDIDALADGLESGHIGGAAVDVFPVEPKGNAIPSCRR
jgi:D-3-phosphoglycerate dehydrogenase